MKKLLQLSIAITCLMSLAFSQASAQSSPISFSLSSDSVGYGTQGSTVTVFGKFYNHTNSTITYKVNRLINKWPAAWGTPENMFCFDGNCYAPTTNSKTNTLASDTNTLFDTEWITGNSDDTGHVLMEFIDLNDSTNRIYQNFYAVITGPSGITNVQVSNNPIAIYPNPFTSAATLSVPQDLVNNGALVFNLYNETGETVKTIPITTGGNTYLDRNDLPSGIYFYSIGNSQNSGNIQRGKILIF